MDRLASNKTYKILYSELDYIEKLAETCPAMRESLEQAKVIYALAGSPTYEIDEEDGEDDEDCYAEADDEWD